MPGMDGYETLNEMKKIPAAGSVPIIFLTGFSDADYEVRGLKSGAVDYIVKPFVKEVLLARVERHLQYEEGRAREERTEEIKENETYKKMQESVKPNRVEDCAGNCKRDGQPGDCGGNIIILMVM